MPGELVNDDYFRVLGVQPRLGRDFTSAERDPVAMLGERLWRERFGADPAVIGTTLYVSGRPFTIIGVIPAAYRGVVLDWGDRPEMWIPMRFYADAVPHLRSFDVLHAWGMQSFLVSGRLKDGVTPAQASDEIASLARRIDADHPERARAWHGEWLARTLPLGQARFWPGARSQILTVLTVLIAVAVGVLLIACANVASLMLTRAAQTHRDTAVRFALGARVRDVGKLLLAESFIIVGLGCAAGLLVGIALTRLFGTFPKLFAIPLALDLSLNLRVAACTAAVGGIVCLVVGLAPLGQAMRTDLVSSLRACGSASLGWKRKWNLRTMLSGVQIALSLVLLVQAGLFLRTFRNAAESDPFLQAGNLLICRIDVPSDQDSKAQTTLARDLPGLAREIPGVSDAVLASVLPMSGMRSASNVTVLEPAGGGAPEKRNVDINAVSPGFFELVGANLLRGRAFTTGDTGGRPNVTLVNEVMAAKYWNGDAVGRRLQIGGDVVSVVGIVRDRVRRSYRGDVPPRVYFPIAQRDAGPLFLVLRTHGNPMTALAPLRSLLARVQPDAVIDAPMTLASYAAVAIAQERLAAWCLSVLAAMAVALSVVGLYGTTAYSVSQRIGEIGIRMALGGTRGHIGATVLRPIAIVSAAGVVCGSLLAAAAVQFTASLFYGVSGEDPLTWLVASLILFAAVVVSAAVPTVRACRIDPAVALRSE